MRDLLLSGRAQKSLLRFPTDEDRLRQLRTDPVPGDAKFLWRHEGEKVFRCRIGEYRALYKVKEDAILVVEIDKRSRVYD